MGLVTGMFIGFAIGAIASVPLLALVVRRQTARARAAESRAQSAQRLAEIGAMTGGLAHEIKNPLSTIGLNAQLLAESISELPIDDLEKGRLVRRIETLRREVERLRDTLADFLKFAGEVRIEPRITDLNSVVEELADFYLPQAQHRGVSLRLDLAPERLSVMLDVSHFKQALLNLLLNATQAMTGPSAEPSPRARELILRTNLARDRDGPTCELHVIDTGPGIPAETLPEIFKPYFTTKSGGTGLGLPTTRRLIEAHGGRIEVNTAPEKGTEFVVVLPRSA